MINEWFEFWIHYSLIEWLMNGMIHIFIHYINEKIDKNKLLCEKNNVKINELWINEWFKFWIHY